MRVLILGRSRVSSAESSVHRALVRRGHLVTLVDDRRAAQWAGRRVANQWLRARARVFGPDLVVVGKALAVSPTALAEVCQGRRSVMWYHDLRVPPLEEIVERARQVDVLFLTAGGQAHEYESGGVRRALFLPGALDSWTERPQSPLPELATDVAFIGSGYDEYRADFLRRLSRGFRLRVWGPGWERWRHELNWTGRPARGRDLARICASAKIVLGINPSFQARSPVWGYASNRMWRIVGCSGFYLGHATPGMRDLLRDHEHCAWYDDEEHACAQLERYLSDGEVRKRIRTAGRAFVAAHHTFEQRIENLLTGEPFRNPLIEAVAR